MAVYRIYIVHPEGRLEPGEAYYCATDAEAVRRFLARPRPGPRAELWQGGRWVAVRADRKPPRSGPDHYAGAA